MNIYTLKYTERETAEEDLYQSREELKEAEERGEGKINWENWDKVAEQTQQQLQDYNQHKPTKKSIQRSVYNLDGQLIAKGTAKALESLLKPYMTLRKENITKYSNEDKIHKGFFFTNQNFKKKITLLNALRKASESKKDNLSL